MTDNEKLIEEAAKAIYAMDPDRQAWDGDAYGFLEPGAERGRKRAIAQARAALAVFEKAHTPADEPGWGPGEKHADCYHGEHSCTPTDDEREARLEYVIDAAVPVDEFPSWRFRYSRRIADAVRAAGFRRSEVSEPSEGHGRHEFCDRRLGCLTEPQGEPSDAQAERARIIADLREWSRPLGNSPEEDTLRLVIARIERAAGGMR